MTIRYGVPRSSNAHATIAQTSIPTFKMKSAGNIRRTLLSLIIAVFSCTLVAQNALGKNAAAKGGNLPDAGMAAYHTDQYVWEKMVRAFQVKTKSPMNLNWELWSTTNYAYSDACGPVKWPTDRLPAGALDSPKIATIINNSPQNFAETQFVILTLNFADPYYEELRINKPMFDYIQKNRLFDQNIVYELAKEGRINFPQDAMMIKAQWLPIKSVDPALAKLYYTKTINASEAIYGKSEETTGPVLMGLVGFHLVTHELPNWVWSTFEFAGNVGLCDFIGCKDKFGSDPVYIAPNEDVNKGYSEGKPTAELLKLFAKFKTPEEFKNYRLKGTQTEYTDTTGAPTIVGNSILEANIVSSSSCISCHARAALDNEDPDNRANLDMFIGTTTGLDNFTPATDTTTLGFHPDAFTGTPIPADYQGDGVSKNSVFYQTNFMWQLAQHAKPCDPSSEGE